MHLATYNIRGRVSFGVVSGDGVVDLRPRLAPRLTSVLDVLRAGALDEVKAGRRRRAAGLSARRGGIAAAGHRAAKKSSASA